MPIFDAELTVPVCIGYLIEGGRIVVDAVLVAGTGQQLPLNDDMAQRILELCQENELEEKIP